MAFNYIREPYGYHRLDNAVWTAYIVEQLTEHQLPLLGQLGYVRGIVIDAHWRGALLCGIAVVPDSGPDDVGTEMIAHYILKTEFDSGEVRKIAG